MPPLLRKVIALLTLLTAPFAYAGHVVLPADISVHLDAQPNSNLSPGEPVVFTLTVVNHGPEVVNTFALISSDFYDQIDLNFGTNDCQGFGLTVADGETFHFNYWWYPTDQGGVLAVGESRTCHFTRALTPQMPVVWRFGFAIPAFIEDINPTNNVSTVTLRRGDIAPMAIPVLSPTILVLLAIALATTACCAFRQRRRSCSDGP